jgi:hypothetical protein
MHSMMIEMIINLYHSSYTMGPGFASISFGAFAAAIFSIRFMRASIENYLTS